MSKVSIQNDKAFRPWKLNPGFEETITHQCADLVVNHKRISLLKKEGDYATVRERRTAADRQLVPKFSHHVSCSIKPVITSYNRSLRGIGLVKQSKIYRESPSSPQDGLPTISRNAGAVLPTNAMGNISQRPRTASTIESRAGQQMNRQNKFAVKEDPLIDYPESTSLDIETEEATVICDQMNSLALDSIQTENGTTIIELEAISDDQAPYDRSSSARDDFQLQRPQTAMPLISSRGNFPSFNTGELSIKSRSTPNLFGSSYIREEREKEYLDERMEWSNRRPATTPGNTTPTNLTPYFATQNFDFTKKGNMNNLAYTYNI